MKSGTSLTIIIIIIIANLTISVIITGSPAVPVLNHNRPSSQGKANPNDTELRPREPSLPRVYEDHGDTTTSGLVTFDFITLEIWAISAAIWQRLDVYFIAGCF